MDMQQRREMWRLWERAWGPADPAERDRLLKACAADEVLYSDPASRTVGRDALRSRIEVTQDRFPGATFVADSILAHHDSALIQWTMYRGDRSVYAHGTSFARFDGDGRVLEDCGFFTAKAAVEV